MQRHHQRTLMMCRNVTTTQVAVGGIFVLSRLLTSGAIINNKNNRRGCRCSINLISSKSSSYSIFSNFRVKSHEGSSELSRPVYSTCLQPHISRTPKMKLWFQIPRSWRQLDHCVTFRVFLKCWVWFVFKFRKTFNPSDIFSTGNCFHSGLLYILSIYLCFCPDSSPSIHLWKKHDAAIAMFHHWASKQ